MNHRTTTAPWVRAVARGLDGVNARHPWNHNDHFHGWVLRRLPRRRRAALDVGCGHGGLLALLAGRFDRADGIDADPATAAWAEARFAEDGRVRVRELTFADVRVPDGLDGYDAVTMVAVLHHLDLVPALEHVRELLAPGGRLLVVGLARLGSRRDVAVDLVSAVANPLVGMIKHPRAVRTTPDDVPPGDRPAAGSVPTMVVRDATATFDEVARVARSVLPGARLRRRLFFRYTLEWTAPR
ncbi:ubiquinone biosynthesis protein [Luteimicrobium album]|uniref:Ubiquinone biosynthesis protein n=1 Tax=Luteimicrobium album TaxID=1054550 RepID=A0ABQ6I956_9MICO|nr:class I SAM-dependent methyltransferase [Luteimicrobium album]GMA26483.1 ubiquinone biosynthesis protein [Luteimicrobium album]